MTPEGELIVRVAWDGSRITGVDLHSSRPHAAARVLVDRTPGEAVAIVPRLFSICGRSQAVAAALACEAASGWASEAETLAARERLVRGEIVQEYLWRMLLDWPPLTGRVAAPQALAGARREVHASLVPDEAAARFGATVAARDAEFPEAIRAAVQQHVLGDGERWNALDDPASGECWLERRAAAPAALVTGLRESRAALGASAVALLPADSERVVRSMDAALAADEAYERAPTWHDAPAETGALARTIGRPLVAHVAGRAGHTVVARLLARVVELTELARPNGRARAALCGAVASAPGRGLGWVETARGLLVHAVELTATHVKRYRIVAPTEWNFHPRGALPAGLAGTTVAEASEVARLAQLVVQSLDPCVTARVVVARV